MPAASISSDQSFGIGRQGHRYHRKPMSGSQDVRDGATRGLLAEVAVRGVVLVLAPRGVGLDGQTVRGREQSSQVRVDRDDVVWVCNVYPPMDQPGPLRRLGTKP